jgi:hypothetical protein
VEKELGRGESGRRRNEKKKNFKESKSKCMWEMEGGKNLESRREEREKNSHRRKPDCLGPAQPDDDDDDGST